MPNFRIAIGFKTEHRNSEPVLLAGSFDQSRLQAAVNAAPPEFKRFAFGVFQQSRSARRTAGVEQPELSGIDDQDVRFVPQDSSEIPAVPENQPPSDTAAEPAEVPAEATGPQLSAPEAKPAKAKR